eukprot:5987156-Pleurochrysis_carterae.AAC.2
MSTARALRSHADDPACNHKRAPWSPLQTGSTAIVSARIAARRNGDSVVSQDASATDLKKSIQVEKKQEWRFRSNVNRGGFVYLRRRTSPSHQSPQKELQEARHESRAL